MQVYCGWQVEQPNGSCFRRNDRLICDMYRSDEYRVYGWLPVNRNAKVASLITVASSLLILCALILLAACNRQPSTPSTLVSSATTLPTPMPVGSPNQEVRATTRIDAPASLNELIFLSEIIAPIKTHPTSLLGYPNIRVHHSCRHN